jgi:ribosomal protein S18 acetylase RimI-like enzyme
MPDNPAFTIRPMRSDDLLRALSLSVAEGWNQTEVDWKLLLNNRNNVCIVAEKDGKVAGTATALNHENKLAWIGMVLVDKSLRGLGAGKMLLKHIIDKLKHIRSVKLDATPAGELLYSKLGFIAEYKIFRLKREAGIYSERIACGNDLEGIDKEIFNEIVGIDKVVFGSERSYLLLNLLNNFPERTLYIKDENGIEGYLFGRDGSRFSYIGPVVAESTDAAKCLISKALEGLTDQPVGVDVPEFNEELLKWLDSVGFVIQRYFVRMYLNVNPFPGEIRKQYLTGGPEFG